MLLLHVIQERIIDFLRVGFGFRLFHLLWSCIEDFIRSVKSESIFPLDFDAQNFFGIRFP